MDGFRERRRKGGKKENGRRRESGRERGREGRERRDTQGAGKRVGA